MFICLSKIPIDQQPEVPRKPLATCGLLQRPPCFTVLHQVSRRPTNSLPEPRLNPLPGPHLISEAVAISDAEHPPGNSTSYDVCLAHCHRPSDNYAASVEADHQSRDKNSVWRSKRGFATIGHVRGRAYITTIASDGRHGRGPPTDHSVSSSDVHPRAPKYCGLEVRHAILSYRYLLLLTCRLSIFLLWSLSDLTW